MRASPVVPPEEDGEAGFVLLSVLLVAMIFVAVGASLAVKSRLSAMQTANRIAAARDGALLDGVVLFVADALRRAPLSVGVAPAGERADGAVSSATRRIELPLALDGRPLSCPTGAGSAIEIRAVDQGGLLDLNAAPVEMMRTLFEAAGIPSETARRLADEAADFRDGDDDPQSNGIPEKAQYAGKGLSPGPRNADFADPGEIGQLPSATVEIVARLAPLLTVWNPNPTLDIATMDRLARARLPPNAASLSELKPFFAPSARTELAVEARLMRKDGSFSGARRGLVAFENGTMRIRRWEDAAFGGADWPRAVEGAPLCGKLLDALGAT